MKTFLSFTIIVTILIQSLSSQSNSYDPPHRKFEYKYSFKGPYLAQKDGAVPFWEYDGNAIASEDMVRITPSLRSKRGSIWTKQPTNFQWWEVEVWIRVSGRGRLGADGIAFWYTENRNPEGPVFGSADQWRGLGIFFDSFDNDGKGNNPYIMAMLNDGTKLYDHQSDGSQQQMAGCLRDFRNKPFPVRAKIEYYNNVLTVMFHSGNSNNEDEYELCLRAENVHLPQHGYFGISAATGGLADDHDALKFLTTSLHPPGSTGHLGPSGTVAGNAVNQAEKERVDKQYQSFLDNLEKQKLEYFKTHPDEEKKYKQQEEMNADHEYETLGEKELQQIFDGQSQMYEALKTLNRKLDEILGRQERTLSMIGTVGAGGTAPVAAGGQAPYQGQVPLASPIQRHEFESLLGAQREILQNSRDVRNMVSQPASAQAGAAGAAGVGSNQLHTQLLTEVRDGINVLRKEMAQVGTRFMASGGGGSAGQQVGCPPTPSCSSPALMGLLIVVNLAVTIGFFVWRDKKNDGPKKFY